ncbi:cathepsin B-like [Planococcus citri]|uniref:cathepsin B-like n=1 Tax=Planococcus citri TaxID=170843 RepID=UPI0031F83365
MYNLYSCFAVFALFSVNIIICKGLIVDVVEEIINVPKTVELYNSIPGLPWTAGRNGLPDNITLLQIKIKLGWIPEQKEISAGPALAQPSDASTNEKDDLPKNYDCRKAYPQCTTIPSIKEQSNCGSCWAVSVAAAFSDRLCIHSNGQKNYNMSADQLLACDKKSDGCGGGYLKAAWQYIQNNGLITGGDYGSNEGCRPYSIPPNQRNSPSDARTPRCGTNKCSDKFKARSSSTSKIESNEYAMRKEIFKNGPITTGFRVCKSFTFYKSGMYKCTSTDVYVGGHAVRVIGWGEENGIKYWLAINSWGTEWGEKGTFKFIRGTDHCGFESMAIAGLPEN